MASLLSVLFLDTVLCDLFAAMGFHSRDFGEDFLSLEITKRPFFSSYAVLREIRWLAILLLWDSG